MVVFCFFAWCYVRQLKAAAACDIQSTKSFGRGSDEGDHRYQPLDRAILLAPLVRQCRRRGRGHRAFTQYVRKSSFTINTNFTHSCLRTIVVSFGVRVV